MCCQIQAMFHTKSAFRTLYNHGLADNRDILTMHSSWLPDRYQCLLDHHTVNDLVGGHYSLHALTGNVDKYVWHLGNTGNR